MNLSQRIQSALTPHPQDDVVAYSIKALLQRYRSDALGQTGAQLAYFFVLSLFPFLMMLHQVIALFNYDIMTVLEDFSQLIPPNMLTLVQSYLTSLSRQQSSGMFTFGAISTILLASKATQSLISALTRAFRLERGLGIGRIVISFLFTLALLLLIPISMLFSSIGKNVLERATDFFGVQTGLVQIWPYLRFIAPFASVVLILSVLYRIIARREVPLHHTLVGALFATGLWVLMALGISYYTSNFGKYSIVYGSLGAVMIMLLFLYWSGIIIVLGGELAHILAMRAPKEYLHDVPDSQK